MQKGLTVRTLRSEARDACKFRNHAMSKFTWSATDRPGRKIGNSFCLDCKMTVHIDTRPPPNGISIGGEAVALNCGGAPLQS